MTELTCSLRSFYEAAGMLDKADKCRARARYVLAAQLWDTSALAMLTGDAMVYPACGRHLTLLSGLLFHAYRELRIMPVTAGRPLHDYYMPGEPMTTPTSA
jgi:hypothetical protein